MFSGIHATNRTRETQRRNSILEAQKSTSASQKSPSVHENVLDSQQSINLSEASMTGSMTQSMTESVNNKATTVNTDKKTVRSYFSKTQSLVSSDEFNKLRQKKIEQGQSQVSQLNNSNSKSILDDSWSTAPNSSLNALAGCTNPTRSLNQPKSESAMGTFGSMANSLKNFQFKLWWRENFEKEKMEK